MALSRGRIQETRQCFGTPFFKRSLPIRWFSCAKLVRAKVCALGYAPLQVRTLECSVTLGEDEVAYRDLREFVQKLEKEGELKRIRAEVDPVLEITEVTQRVAQALPSVLRSTVELPIVKCYPEVIRPHHPGCLR
jgi:hypothetical protein